MEKGSHIVDATASKPWNPRTLTPGEHQSLPHVERDDGS